MGTKAPASRASEVSIWQRRGRRASALNKGMEWRRCPTCPGSGELLHVAGAQQWGRVTGTRAERALWAMTFAGSSREGKWAICSRLQTQVFWPHSFLKTLLLGYFITCVQGNWLKSYVTFWDARCLASKKGKPMVGIFVCYLVGIYRPMKEAH